MKVEETGVLPVAPAAVLVESINDYALGPAIAERFDLWGPLKGDRLLRFFEVLVEAHDRYHEALTDPVMVLGVIHRPPVGTNAVDQCWSAATALFTERRSLHAVLAATGLDFDALKRAIPAVSRNVSMDRWLEAERWITTNSNGTINEMIEATGLSKDDTMRLRHLYGYQASRSTRIGAPKLPKEAHDAMIGYIRDGKHGTEIASLLKQRFDVTISRSLVTKTRQRLTERGIL